MKKVVTTQKTATKLGGAKKVSSLGTKKPLASANKKLQVQKIETDFDDFDDWDAVDTNATPSSNDNEKEFSTSFPFLLLFSLINFFFLFWGIKRKDSKHIIKVKH